MPKKYLITPLFLLPLMLFMLTCCQRGEQPAKTQSLIPVAILTPITHPSLEAIEEGFKTQLEQTHPHKYRFVTYNAQGNPLLMRSELEEIARNAYPLLFTIASNPTQMAKEVLARKRVPTAIVFAAVNDPIGFQIVTSEEHPGGQVTGVKELLDFDAELSALLHYQPHLNTLLLVYNPAEPGLQKDRQYIEGILEKKGIKLLSAEVFQINEIKPKVSALIPSAQAILILKDNIVVAGLEALIKLCEEQQIPLMASDLDSPGRGAAFGYGVEEREFGVEAAKKAEQILEGHKHPGDLAVTPVGHFTLKINAAAAQRQGISASALSSQPPGIEVR